MPSSEIVSPGSKGECCFGYPHFTYEERGLRDPKYPDDKWKTDS